MNARENNVTAAARHQKRMSRCSRGPTTADSTPCRPQTISRAHSTRYVLEQNCLRELLSYLSQNIQYNDYCGLSEEILLFNFNQRWFRTGKKKRKFIYQKILGLQIVQYPLYKNDLTLVSYIIGTTYFTVDRIYMGAKQRSLSNYCFKLKS